MLNRRIGLLIAAFAVMASLAGCAGSSQQQEDLVDVAQRPGLAQAVARYDEMQQRIRDRLDAELGPFAWEQTREGSRSVCGSEAPDAHRMYMAPWRFDGGIPDQDWPRAHDIARTTAAEYGFTDPAMQINNPGHHRTTAIDPTLGAFFDFRTQLNTLMQVSTGCHPTS